MQTMYKSLKGALKKKIDNGVKLKVLFGLADKQFARLFLNKNVKNFYIDTINAVAYQQLKTFNIKQGSLLFLNESIYIDSRDSITGLPKKINFPKASFIVPISFEIGTDNELEKFPSIKLWFTVLHNERIWHVDAEQFLNFATIKYVVLYDLIS